MRLLQSGAVAARTLQVKPENLADAPPKNGLEHLSAPELCLLTLSEHAAVSAAQMEGVIELLSSGQAGQQLTEADLSLLLRVVCCFGWHVASHRDRATGEETPALLPHPEHGSGLVLCTAPDRLERIGQVAGEVTPAGADKCASLVRGAALFLSDVLAQTGYLSLNPEDPTPAAATGLTAEQHEHVTGHAVQAHAAGELLLDVGQHGLDDLVPVEDRVGLPK